ncbi:hypothetical protein KM043_005696 [Ampulex compressa]|nr:hypothetical protein KM043_005696 [Ampulex compressa]
MQARRRSPQNPRPFENQDEAPSRLISPFVPASPLPPQETLTRPVVAQLQGPGTKEEEEEEEEISSRGEISAEMPLGPPTNLLQPPPRGWERPGITKFVEANPGGAKFLLWHWARDEEGGEFAEGSNEAWPRYLRIKFAVGARYGFATV